MQSRILFACPIILILFFGYPISRLPFNPFACYLANELVASPLKSPLWTAAVVGFLHDILLPSPRIGAFTLAYLVTAVIMSALLRKITAAKESLFGSAIVAGFSTLLIETLSRSIMWFLAIPTNDTSLFHAGFILIPALTCVVTFALNLVLFIVKGRRSARYD